MSVYHAARKARATNNSIPLTLCYSVATFIGDLLYFCWPRARYYMKQGISSLLGTDVNSPRVRRVARQCLRNFCRYGIDFIRFVLPSRPLSADSYRIQGLHHLDAALHEGKGAILVSFHLGNFDLGARLLREMGYPVTAVVNRVPLPVVDGLVARCRIWSGVKLLRSGDGVQSMIDVLRNNEVLVMMMDCQADSRYVNIEFGNRLAKIPVIAATLALRTGASIIPCGLVRSSDGTFLGYMESAVPFHPAKRHSADVTELTRSIIHSIMPLVAEFIDQWYLFHPFFQDVLQETDRAISGDLSQILAEPEYLEATSLGRV